MCDRCGAHGDGCMTGSIEARACLFVVCPPWSLPDAFARTHIPRTHAQDRDGCPKIVNLGSSKTDLFYERKKYGFKR